MEYIKDKLAEAKLLFIVSFYRFPQLSGTFYLLKHFKDLILKANNGLNAQFRKNRYIHVPINDHYLEDI